MELKKRRIDQKIGQAMLAKGLLIVHTGAGKGKSTAAFGMVVRALGHSMKVGIVQFIKGAKTSGEIEFFRKIKAVDLYVMGQGFSWETQDKSLDQKAATLAWEKALAMLKNPDYALVVLDELNLVLNKNDLELDEVLTALNERPAHQHVVVTGRYAPQALCELADTVSEVQEIKHAFKAGVKAQKGIEL